LCLIVGGRVRTGIDLVKGLSLTDIAAFGEQAFDHDACDLGAYFGDFRSHGPPRQFGHQGHGSGLCGDDADDDRGGRGRLLAVACRQGGKGQDKRCHGRKDGCRKNG
jgi:hypothetical protein